MTSLAIDAIFEHKENKNEKLLSFGVDNALTEKKSCFFRT